MFKIAFSLTEIKDLSMLSLRSELPSMTISDRVAVFPRGTLSK